MREEQLPALISGPTTTHHHVTSQDMHPRSLSFPTKITSDGSPSQTNRTLFPQRGYRSKKLLLWRTWAQESKGQPNSLDGHPNEGWAHEWPELWHTSLKGASIRNQVPTGLTLDESL